jgi:hypothetical protein
MATLDNLVLHVLEQLAQSSNTNWTPISVLLQNAPHEDISRDNHWEIANELERRELTKNLKVGAGPSLKLTLKGRDFLANSNVSYIAKDKFSAEEIPQLEDKLDHLFEKLNELRLGQEIIFDDIQDMKKLLHVLNKNDWKSIVKGKLFEMGLGSFTESFVQSISEHFPDFKLLE